MFHFLVLLDVRHPTEFLTAVPTSPILDKLWIVDSVANEESRLPFIFNQINKDKQHHKTWVCSILHRQPLNVVRSKMRCHVHSNVSQKEMHNLQKLLLTCYTLDDSRGFLLLRNFVCSLVLGRETSPAEHTPWWFFHQLPNRSDVTKLSDQFIQNHCLFQRIFESCVLWGITLNRTIH